MAALMFAGVMTIGYLYRARQRRKNLFRGRRPLDKEIYYFQPVVIPALCKSDTSSDCGVIVLAVSSRRIEQNEDACFWLALAILFTEDAPCL